jgi:hypothetical protein
MGKVATTQPNAGGNPTARLHTIRPLDPAVDGKDLPVTTIYREWSGAANGKGRIHSVLISEVNLEFPAGDHIRVSAGLVGSGQETTGALATTPALQTEQLLLSNDVKFFRGTQGSPAEISSRIVRNSIRFRFAYQFDEENSRFPGSGLFRGRAWADRPDWSLEWQEFIDDSDVTVHDNYLSQATEEVKLLVEGAVIGSGPEKHQLEIRFLAAKPKITAKAEAAGKSIYSYQIGFADAFREGSNDVITVKVQNTQTSYLV